MQWLEIKMWLEAFTELDRDALHIYGAVGIQLLTAIFFRRSLGSIWPWLFAFTAAIANEYVDLQSAGITKEAIAIAEAESIHDLWNTMILPTLFLLIARFWPSWLVGKQGTKTEIIEDAVAVEKSI